MGDGEQTNETLDAVVQVYGAPPPEAWVPQIHGGERNQGKLEKPRIREALIRDLALREIPQTKMAAKYGVSQAAISKFLIRHESDIVAAKDRVQELIDNEFAHLWSYSRINRVTELQGAYERIERTLDAVEHDEGLRATVNTAEMIRTQAQILKAIADETGQSKQVVEVHGIQVTYHVEGVDMSKLQ